MNRRWLWVVAGLLIGAALLWYSVRSVSLSQVMGLVADAHLGFLLLAVGLSATFMAVKTARWSMLLRPASGLGFADLHLPVYAGTAANLVVSHFGELIRARMVGRVSDLPAAAILASIGLERVLDMLAMLVILGYLFAAGENYLTPSLAAAAEVVAALAFAGMLAISSLLLWPARCIAIVDRMVAWLPRAHREWIARQLEHVADGFKVIGNPWLMVRVLVLSVVQWCVIAASIWCCMSAVDVTLTGVAALAVLVVLVLGLTLPTAPAYVGTTQVAFTATLGLFGVNEQTAFAGSVLYTTCVVLPPLFVGAVCLLRHFQPARDSRVVTGVP